MYGSSSGLFFTYTDSLMYEFKTDGVYEDFNRDKKMFDIGNCSPKSKYYDNSNKCCW